MALSPAARLAALRAPRSYPLPLVACSGAAASAWFARAEAALPRALADLRVLAR